jgi:thioesterase domain-containing protein
MRATGAKPPLVLLPPLGGDVNCYTELVRQLGHDQPVHVFRLRGFDEDLPPHANMDEMIADYLAALRRLQPTGPYYLAGWSLGGIYAFALGEALDQAGDDVALLAMFDTPTPSICDEVDVEDDAGFLLRMISFGNRLAGANLRVDDDALRARVPDDRFAFLLDEARRHGLVSAEAPESIIRRLVRVGEANVRSIQGYSPRRLEISVQYFAPTTKGALLEVAEREIDETGDRSWRVEVGQQVEMHEVPGDHFTMMFGAGVVQIARRLATLLDAQLAVRK